MIPRYGEWARRYGEQGLAVIGVHSPETEAESSEEELRAFVRGNDIRWRVVLDPYHDAWRRFRAEAWPTLLLIDRAGVVRGAYVGQDHAAEVQREIERLLAR